MHDRGYKNQERGTRALREKEKKIPMNKEQRERERERERYWVNTTNTKKKTLSLAAGMFSLVLVASEPIHSLNASFLPSFLPSIQQQDQSARPDAKEEEEEASPRTGEREETDPARMIHRDRRRLTTKGEEKIQRSIKQQSPAPHRSQVVRIRARVPRQTYHHRHRHQEKRKAAVAPRAPWPESPFAPHTAPTRTLSPP